VRTTESWPGLPGYKLGYAKRKRREPAGPQGRASLASAGLRAKNREGEKGLSRLGFYQGSGPWPVENEKRFSIFQIFSKFQTNLNSNQIYNFDDFHSHNKI
jgi:hypothetical protein